MKNWKVYVTTFVMVLVVWLSVPVQAAGNQIELPEDGDDIRGCVATMKQTVYTQGDKLNLDGLQLQAYDYWGNIWTFSGDELVTNADSIDTSSVAFEDEFNNTYVNLEVSVKGHEEDINNVVPICVYKKITDGSDDIYTIIANKLTKVYNVGDTLDTKDLTVYGMDLNSTVKELSTDDYTVDTSEVDMSKAGEYEITVNYESSNLGYSCNNNVYIYVLEKAPKLTKITATKKKTTYQVGEKFDIDDLVVTGYYEDGSTKEIMPYDYDNDLNGYYTDASDIDTSEAGKQTLHIWCGEGSSVETSCDITIIITDGTSGGEITKQLNGISIQYTSPVYEIGDELSIDEFGLKVTAAYSDNTTRVLSEDEYTTDIEKQDTKTAGKHFFTVSYTENGVTKTAEVTYIVEQDSETPEKILTGITATKVKKEYEVGEEITVDDLTVTAVYDDKSEVKLDKDAYTTNVTKLSTTKAGKLTLTVTYTEGEITRTFDIMLTVKDKTSAGEKEAILESIKAVKTKTEYEVGDNITVDDLKVTAVYDDKSEIELDKDAYTTNVTKLNTTKAGKLTLTVTYTEGEITKTFDIMLTVKDKTSAGEKEAILESIKAVKAKTEYEVGDNITVDDLKVTAVYDDKSEIGLDKDSYVTNVDKISTATAGIKILTVTYEKNGVKKTTKVTLTVKVKSVTTPDPTPTPDPVPTPSQAPTPQPSAPMPSMPAASPSTTTQTTTSVTPGNISGLKVKALGKKKVSVKWGTAKNAFAYLIQVSTKKNFKKAKNLTTSETKYTLKNLKKGKTYYIRVRAASYDKQWSAWSKVKKIKVK